MWPLLCDLCHLGPMTSTSVNSVCEENCNRSILQSIHTVWHVDSMLRLCYKAWDFEKKKKKDKVKLNAQIQKRVHVNVGCCRLVNHPVTPRHYWFQCANVRHSLCCLHRWCVWKALEENPAAEKPAGPRMEIRHKPDTLDSVEQLGPRCAQPCYESFGDEGEKTLVPRQETKDGDELYCHDNLEQLSLLVCCVRCSLLHFRIIFQTLKTCACMN